MATIAKTRQPPANLRATVGSRAEEIFDPEVGRARGVLMPPPEEGLVRHTRRRPPADLAEWIEHFWSVSWDLRGCDPFLQQTLPHPNIHAVFEPSRSGIAGVTTKRFSRTLEGESRVFGIKFRPGGFRPFLGKPVATLNDRVVPIETVFGSDGAKWESGILSLKEEEEQIETASAFLRARLPEADENVALATRLVVLILEDREIRSVSDLTRCTQMGTRSLQRLFRDYVGASPKWVIRRYRLHELVERLKAGEALNGAQMALDLGYSDQAHLINDFRSIVGYSPSRYRSLLRNA
jgi:AraC-like DNA-binding protein